MPSVRLDTDPQRRLANLASQFPDASPTQVSEAVRIAALGDERGAAGVLRDLLAGRRVGLAAWARSTGRPLTGTERIAKASAALAHSPTALDILHASLAKVASSPTTEKYRKVDVARPGVFRDRVAPSPGATELLYAVGFEPLHGHLVLQKHEPTLLRAALDTLEATRQGAVYREAKARLTAEAARRAVGAQAEAEASARRAAALAKVPAEPAEGDGDTSACVLTFHVSGERVARRRFDSENTLVDVLNFVRSLARAPAEPLVLENITTRPPRLLDPASHGSASLYALDLWPVGHVQVRSAA